MTKDCLLSISCENHVQNAVMLLLTEPYSRGHLCSTSTSNGSRGIHNFSVNTIQHALGIKASPFTLSGCPHFPNRATERQVVTKHPTAYDRLTAGDVSNVEANGFGLLPSTIFHL